MTTGRFPLGRTLATPGALEALSASPEEMLTILARHRSGDWGGVAALSRLAELPAYKGDEEPLTRRRGG